MRLMRYIIRKKGELLLVRGEFKSNEGKRVRLSLGPPITKEQVPALMAAVEIAAPNLKALRQVRGV